MPRQEETATKPETDLAVETARTFVVTALEATERGRVHGRHYRRYQMDGYDETTYGEAFADVYDEWYAGISDIDATVSALLQLAGEGAVLELGVGTGRLAIPLAEAGADRGLRVTGIDTSAAMLGRLHDRLATSVASHAVTTITGDMVNDLPDGPFSLVLIAYNTLFNLTEPERQASCFAAVARRLNAGGRFVVEAFVPDDPPRRGNDLALRSMSADRVVLSASMHDPDGQRAEGQFIELTEGGGVRLRPWAIRYSTPEQIDGLATDAGLELEARWAAFGDRHFDAESPRHVSVYRRR